MKIGFFGGSFNPPHRGHTGVAEAVLATGKVDQIYLALSYHAPHKDRAEVSFFDRMAMLKLAVRGRKNLIPCDVENVLKLSPSYTLKILDYLSQTEGQHQFSLIIGEDSLRDLHLWYHAKELVERYPVITYVRSNTQNIRPENLPAWPCMIAEQLCQNVLYGDFFQISSSEIRNSMAKDPNWCHINREAIDGAVADYIVQHQLYRNASAK